MFPSENKRFLELFRLVVAFPEALDQRRQSILPVLELTAQVKDLVVFLLQRSPGGIVAFFARLHFRLQLLALRYRLLEARADFFQFALQLVAALERFLERVGEFACPIGRVLARGLQLAYLLHERPVLLEKALVLGALCFQLSLPALVDCDLFLGAAVAPGDPADHRPDRNRSCNECDECGSNIGHGSVRVVYP